MDAYLVLLQVGFTVPVCYQTRGALLPHRFTLTTQPPEFPQAPVRRSTLCCTIRRLTPPRRYLALCPM